jgi:hypothetical protein
MMEVVVVLAVFVALGGLSLLVVDYVTCSMTRGQAKTLLQPVAMPL